MLKAFLKIVKPKIDENFREYVSRQFSSSDMKPDSNTGKLLLNRYSRTYYQQRSIVDMLSQLEESLRNRCIDQEFASKKTPIF